MTANPVLVEVMRGNAVENIHRGAIAVCNAKGNVLASVGDIERRIFPRSAIKSMQALAMFKSGAVERFGLTDEDIALACASHNGEARHVEGVKAFEARVGLSVDDLECGAHSPADKDARKALQASGERPSQLHNNCSGKHSGMLAVAKALGIDLKDYVTREHDVQKLVRASVEEVMQMPMSPDYCGTDGCSIPTWAAPLKGFASGFARMATGEGLADDTAVAAKRIFAAATSHPFLVRGSQSLDTELMEAFGGRLMLKIGAEGVFCGALIDTGVGFALKIDDGNFTAAEATVSKLLLSIANPDAKEKAALEKWARKTLSNWRKIEVAEVRTTDAAALSI